LLVYRDQKKIEIVHEVSIVIADLLANIGTPNPEVQNEGLHPSAAIVGPPRRLRASVTADPAVDLAGLKNVGIRNMLNILDAVVPIQVHPLTAVETSLRTKSS